MTPIQEARRRIAALTTYGNGGWLVVREEVLAILDDAERQSAEAPSEEDE